MWFSNSIDRYCAFCRLDHRVYIKKEVSVFDCFVLLGVTGLFSLAIWGEPDLRSMLIFVALAYVMQMFIRMRYRESLKCPHCGFDPVLYRQNPKFAAKKVKTFLKEREDNPDFMLKPTPQIKPLQLSREDIALLKKSGEWKDFEDDQALVETSTEPSPPEVSSEPTL